MLLFGMTCVKERMCQVSIGLDNQGLIPTDLQQLNKSWGCSAELNRCYNTYNRNCLLQSFILIFLYAGVEFDK
jgi:hypothetical protein